MSDQTPHRIMPAYSKPWLGRKFVLTAESMMWGRYAVPSRSTSKSTMHSAELEALAQTFREQLRAHTPDDVGYFDSEVQLLRALHNEGGRQHPRTLDAVLRAVRLAQGEVWQT